jgi:hypothetical protein
MVGFNERKKVVLVTLYKLGGAGCRRISNELDITLYNADTVLRHYLYDGKWGYVYRRKTKQGYKYYVNWKGKRWLRIRGLI